MLWLRKSKKGFTLIELMVVVAIIGILALLGLRMYTTQQNKAKNAIVKANTATVHTIIQGNLADTDYSTDTGVGNTTGTIDDVAAVKDIRDDDLELLPDAGGTNDDRPAGMKNPHLTGDTNFVVIPVGGADGPTAWVTFLALPGDPDIYAGVVLVGNDTEIANRFYIIGLNDKAEQLGEVYIATK